MHDDIEWCQCNWVIVSCIFKRKCNSFTMIAHERVPDVVYYQSARNYSHYQDDGSWKSAEIIWCGILSINYFRQPVIILVTSPSEEEGCETLEPQQEWWADHIKGFFMHTFMPHQRILHAYFYATSKDKELWCRVAPLGTSLGSRPQCCILTRFFLASSSTFTYSATCKCWHKTSCNIPQKFVIKISSLWCNVL